MYIVSGRFADVCQPLSSAPVPFEGGMQSSEALTFRAPSYVFSAVSPQSAHSSSLIFLSDESVAVDPF